MTDIAAIAERERNLESLMPKFYNHLYIDGVAEVAFPSLVFCAHSSLPVAGWRGELVAQWVKIMGSDKKNLLETAME